MNRDCRSLVVALASGLTPILACNAIVGNEAGILDPTFGTDAADAPSVGLDAAQDQRVDSSGSVDAGDELVGKFAFRNQLGSCLEIIQLDAGGEPLVRTGSCDDTPARRWNVQRVEIQQEGVFYWLTNEQLGSSVCLESGSPGEGASMQPCGLFTGRLWTFERELAVATPIVYRLHTPQYTGIDRCLMGREAGTRPIIDDCRIDNGQLWQRDPR